jgi:glycosyltransferase involved in cell wall biosynthesis
MHILYLANHFNTGGITSYLINLARGMKKLGEDIVIASRGGDKLKTLTKYNIEHIKIPLKTKSEVSPKVLFSYLILRNYVKKNKIDIIHANTRITQVLAYFLSKKFNIPFVTTVHGGYIPKWNRKIFPVWGEKIIAISEFVKKWLIEKFKLREEKISVIYNGIDINYFSQEINAHSLRDKYRIKKNTIVIGNIARFSFIKGHFYLISAFKKLLLKYRNIMLLLVGEGKEKNNILKFLYKEGIKGNYILIENLDDVRDALNLIDIFVMPSLQEGLGLSILEAMASNKAIIATNTGGIPELISNGKNGILVPVKDANSLISTIGNLIEDEKKRKEISSQAKKDVMKFDYKKMSLLTLNLYKKILK